MRLFNLLLAGLFLFCAAQAQVSSMRFRQLTIDDGLSQNAARALLQDSRGYVWIGTKDGLNRYDGYEFRIFLSDPFNRNTLDNNNILSLYEDSRGMLWVGTTTGVSMYDPQTEQFTRIALQGEWPIKAIAESASGYVWVSSLGGGAFVIDPDSIHAESYQPINILNTEPLLRNIRCMVSDGDLMWIGCDRGLLKMNDHLEILSAYDLYVKAPEAPTSELDSAITGILDDGKGYLWLGTPSGLIHFDKTKGTFQFYPHHFATYRYGWGTIHAMSLERNADKIWIGTADELMLFHTRDLKYEYLQYDPGVPFGINPGGAIALFQDQAGLMWVGSNGHGINIYDPIKHGFKTIIRDLRVKSRINDFSVRTIYEDKKGDVWISGRILYKWHRETGRLQSFEKSSTELEAMGNTGVWSVIEDREGWLWFGTYEGLYKHRTEDSLVVHYRYDPQNPDGIPEKNVFEVFEDRHGEIWIITQHYISMLDQKTGHFIRHRILDRKGNYELFFPSIHEDKSGTFWINTDQGLLKFDPVTGQANYIRTDPANIKSLNNSVIRCICPDPFQPDSILWLGTAGGGLNRYEIHTGEVTHVTTQDGLPDNVVYGILPDNDGQLWMSTNKGICAYHIATGRIKKYDVTDGLQSQEFNSGAFFKSKSGEMFFGGINGVNHFYPDDIRENQHIPNIVITRLSIGNQALHPNEQTPLFEALRDASTPLTLSHKDDIISFEYASLDYSAPSKNQYRYKLVGWDSEWIEAGTRRIATYSNLSPGRYTFLVTGSNNDLFWNPKGASLSLYIPPPWYASILAFVFYGVLVFGAAVALYRYRLGKLKLQYQLELELVEKQQLRQLDTLKTRFFTNISHEFRTPLTLIHGPVQLLRRHVSTAQGQNLLQLIEQNAQRLLALINEILDLSKLESGKIKLDVRPGDIITHLRDLTTLHDSAVRHMDKTLVFTGFAPQYFCTYDHGKVEKIVANLLSNAIKNTATGDHIAIHITQDSHSAQNQLIITISDTGRGIPTEELPYIFTRFFRGENQESVGSGIGLSFVKELTELMHGTITAESEPGKETTFIVTLPVKAVPSIPTSDVIPIAFQAPEYAQALRTETPEHGRQVLLIVEDSAPIRTLIATAFADTYHILEAGEGQAGEEIALEQIPDIIITDLMMPVKDGMAMCDALKKDEKTSHIPIVMLTARADKDAMIQGYDTGADAYVIKPFEIEILNAQVRNLLQIRQTLRNKYSQRFFSGAAMLELQDADTEWCNRLRTLLENHLSEEDFGIDQLSAAMNLSRRQIQRKCNALFGIPPNEFIRNYRLERAKKFLEARTGTVSEVCYAVGFSSLSYFSRCYKEYFNQLPSEIHTIEEEV